METSKFITVVGVEVVRRDLFVIWFSDGTCTVVESPELTEALQNRIQFPPVNEA